MVRETRENQLQYSSLQKKDRSKNIPETEPIDEDLK